MKESQDPESSLAEEYYTEPPPAAPSSSFWDAKNPQFQSGESRTDSRQSLQTSSTQHQGPSKVLKTLDNYISPYKQEL